jgi:hypothetical protein
MERVFIISQRSPDRDTRRKGRGVYEMESNNRICIQAAVGNPSEEYKLRE